MLPVICRRVMRSNAKIAGWIGIHTVMTNVAGASQIGHMQTISDPPNPQSHLCAVLRGDVVIHRKDFQRVRLFEPMQFLPVFK